MGHGAQAMRAIVLASATATNLNGRRAGSWVSLDISQGSHLGTPQDGMRADNKKALHVAATLLGDRTEPCLPEVELYRGASRLKLLGRG
jgi:hypothetical protein